MSSPSAWFSDPDHLLQALQQNRRERAPLPQLAGYDDLVELGRGGQGVVYAGTQRSTRRRVAIKLLLDGVYASAASRRRFEREIDAVARLRHPGIPQVYDSGVTADERPYLIMELVQGLPLDEWAGLRGQPQVPLKDAGSSGAGVLDIPAIVALFAEVCDAVSYAHQNGVIHRDLKPANILVVNAIEGSRSQGSKSDAGQTPSTPRPLGPLTPAPKVLDFGLAKLVEESPDARPLSHTGMFMGSLPWASPEQAGGSQSALDVRSDVYSLGVILYQALTGRLPYRLDGPLHQALESIRTAAPTPPREWRPDIDDELATIVLKCLSKEPERRYQSAAELARDLRRYLAGDPIEAKRDSAWYAVRKTLNRYRVTVRAVSVLLVASVAFSIAMVWLRERAVGAERLAAQRLHDLEIAHRAEVEARKALETQVSRTLQIRDFLDTTLRAVDPWKHPNRDLGPLRELLDSAVQRLVGAFPDQPEVEAALAGTLGWDYRELGLHESAEPLLRRSYELYCATVGESDPRTRESLNYLAMLMGDLGRHAEGVELFQRLLAIQGPLIGPEHPETLVTLNNLALELDWLGRSTEAETLYRRALVAQTRIVGPHNKERLSTLNNLAACLPALGKLDEAERLHRELIDIHTSDRGADDPATLQARMNIANLHTTAGRLADAETELRDVLGRLERTIGLQHPLAISVMHNLADVVSNLGRHDEGLALARRAFEAQSAFAGADHPTTLMRKNELATTLIGMGRLDEGIPLAAELHQQWSRLFGPADWRTLTAAGNLAFALNQTGKTADAERLWSDVIASANPEHEASRTPLATAHANLASLLADQARWPEAEAAFRAALEIQGELGQQGSWRTAFIRAGLGRVLAEMQRPAEAEAELVPACQRLREILGVEHEKTRRALGYLVRLYEMTGRRELAETLRRELVPADRVSEQRARE